MDDVSIHHKNTELEAIQMDWVNYHNDVPTHSLGSDNTYLHEGELQFMYKDTVCVISMQFNHIVVKQG